jgi:hypothetical protein
MSDERFPISPNPAEWDVYDVVAGYSDDQAKAPDDRGVLKRWIDRFPQFSHELSAIAYDTFASGESLHDAVDADEPSADVESIARSVAFTHGGSPAKVDHQTAPLLGIISTAQEQGLSPKQLAVRLRIDTPLLAKLDQRLVDAATIPARLCQMIAEAIERSVDEVSAYLAGPPRLASQAHYKAEDKPGVHGSARQSFADALAASPKVSSDDREFWRTESEKHVE